uniref:Uncharacterized protein n=1 Tax=Cacopsylla melanoneura TaxID=428564 RepID=A0A8D8VY45_9HEMI
MSTSYLPVFFSYFISIFVRRNFSLNKTYLLSFIYNVKSRSSRAVFSLLHFSLGFLFCLCLVFFISFPCIFSMTQFLLILLTHKKIISSLVLWPTQFYHLNYKYIRFPSNKPIHDLLLLQRGV